MLGQYLEAGGSLAEFWSIETPRTTLIRVSAYYRRRGWSAYWTAALGRFSWKGEESGIPSLEAMMGVKKPPIRRQSNDVMLAAMRGWAAGGAA